MARSRALAAILSTTVCVVAIAEPAIAETPVALRRMYRIPPERLNRALDAFARQSSRQVIYKSDEVRPVHSRGVIGIMSADEALVAVLAYTGFTFRSNASGAVAIVRASTPSGEVLAGGVPASETPVDEQAISDILVVGSRSLNADVRRGEDDDQPYVVFGRADIQAAQATNLEDFLRRRLPQNATFQGTNSQVPGVGNPFTSFNLRGLGPTQTLILVNGRRMASRSTGVGTPGQPDINGIPMASIERIEILPSSAGGIYGGNAVGGVINIILRNNYRGLEITGTYNDTADLKANDVRLDVVGGFALEGGRTSLTFSGTISRTGNLRISDRPELISRGLELGYANFPPIANAFTPLGNAVNIRSTNGTNLVLDPQFGGVNLGSSVTNAPLGYGGVASDRGAALISRAGTYNLDIPDDINGYQRSIRTASDIKSFDVAVRRKFAKWFDVFVDYSRLQNSGRSFGSFGLSTGVTLAAAAPTNPFQQQISVTFPSIGYSFPYYQKSIMDRLNGGVILRLPGKWAANIEYNKSWSRSTAKLYQTVTDTFLTQCGFQASTAATCSGKPVIDPLRAPIDYKTYLFTEPTALVGPYRSEFDNPVLRASGPLFKLPGGSTTLTFAVQREASSYKRAQEITLNSTTRAKTYNFLAPRFQRTNSAYGEIAFPLVSAAQKIPLLRELELRAAVRHDDYLTKAAPVRFAAFETLDPTTPFPDYTPVKARFKSTNYTLAGRWSPMKRVVLRASYATGFLPPTVAQVSSVAQPLPQLNPDPFRGNRAEGYIFSQILGVGNASLKPERSRSLSIGVILTPIEGLRFSADYTRIRKRDEIGVVPVTYILANPDQFPGRVVREANPQPGDPAGFLGRIISIDNSAINLLRSQYKTVDYQLDYTMETERAGRFRFYAIATWQPDSVRKTTVLAPALNYSGNRDGPLKLQGNGGVDWSYNGLTVQWNTQYYHHYNVYNTFDGRTAVGATSIASAVRLQGSRRIPVQTYSDLFVAYDFSNTHGPLKGLRLSGGLQNIFNQKPPAIAVTTYSGAGYSVYGDPRLRRFTIAIRKAFGNK